MNRENLAFLFGGLAFGVLIGFGAYHAVESRPGLGPGAALSGATTPRGPQAPTQTGGPNAGGGAPMVAEINRLKERLQANPNDPEVLVRLANIYQDAGMWAQAVGYYERAIEGQPDNPDLMTDLGVCYRGLREFDKALEIFKRANGINPSHWQSLFNIVVVAAFDLNRADLAMTALESMEAIEPRPADLAQGRLEELRQALETRAAEGTSGES